MLTLTDKIGIRAGTLWTIYQFIKPSTWIEISIIISFYKFYHYGLAMYQERFADKMALSQYLHIFVDRSVTPYMLLLVGVVVVEYILIAPMFYKYIVSRAKD